MKISIITVVFNSAKTLERSINSVINQSSEDMEYIVIEGASTDGSREIIKKYDDQITCWIREPDSGMY